MKMTLVDVINKITGADVGTFIVCKEHFAELNKTQIESLFKIRKLTDGFLGECVQCSAKMNQTATPIDFDPTPENIVVFVTFDDDTDEEWSASERAGHLSYVVDNDGSIYTTKEALRRRGVNRLYIEAGYELHIDDIQPTD